MKQLLQSYRSGEIWLAEVPVPSVQAHGVVVRTAASIISSGTERMITELARRSLLGKAVSRPDLVRQVIRRVRVEGLGQTLAKVFAKLNTPIPLGYSCSGVVTEVGSAVRTLSVGDRVACAGTGYATHAELNYVPANLCVRLPPKVSFAEGAFAGVGAVAVNALRLAEVEFGERVAVIGLGLIGLLTGQLLKAAGCGVLGCDIDPRRCRMARELGFDRVACGTEIHTASVTYTGGQGLDAVIVTAASQSAEPLVWAGEICRLRGRVVVVGLVQMHVPRDIYYSRELDLRVSRSYGPGRYDPEYEEKGRDYPYGYVRWTEQRNMAAFVEAVRRGQVEPLKLAGRRLAIDEAPEAYRLLFGPAGEGQTPITVVIEYLGVET
ncbi:MAG TPA: zinc-binding alcohol dehydrogenase, partial [Kiritimatiellae bacterium]|nr:zinc-binding alcohol dehydrogenase [Kiritimatiellia bacterium]